MSVLYYEFNFAREGDDIGAYWRVAVYRVRLDERGHVGVVVGQFKWSALWGARRMARKDLRELARAPQSGTIVWRP